MSVLLNTNLPILKEIVDLIVSEVSPDQIILFGSHARGDARESSDIDLLILKKGLEDERGFTDVVEDILYHNHISVAVDHIAMDYDRYYKMNDVIGYIYSTIKDEGKIIHETV